MILLTPGPCLTSDAVRAAAALPDLNHRDPQYEGVQAEVRGALARLGGGHVPYVIGGSGTAAMEATVSSCIEEGPCLVIANGYYAERYERIFDAHEIECEVMRFPWSSAWDLKRIEERLEDEEHEAILMTHHETSTGRLNPIAEVALMAKPYGMTVLVDAVSSLGAEMLTLEGVHAAFSSSNKCLHGLPGVSFVLLEPTFATKIAKFPARTFYLHLPMYAGERPPLTPPVPAMRAFRQALVEFESSGGTAARHERYARQALRVRSALREMGCGVYVPDAEASCAVTVATVPRGYLADSWLRANYEAGFVLFECKGEMRETHFQVSTMGEVTDEVVVEWIAVADKLIHSRQ
jgi:2-aminoethylphosphonate-pyruvate transaminase